MKKFLALFLSLMLVSTVCSLFVNAADESDTTPITDGFVFNIANVNTTVVAEKGLILTNKTAYDASKAGWSILILCEKVSDNLYKAKEDAKIPSKGDLPAITFNKDDIVISIHSSSSDMKDIDKYANIPQKNQAMKVKAGMFFTLSGIDLTKAGAVTGTAKVSINDPSSTTNPPKEDTKETIAVDGKLDDNGWLADGWTKVNSTNGRWMAALDEGVTRPENYQFQFRADDKNLYFGFKSFTAPLGTDALNGNGNGSNIRLWIFNDGHKDADGVAYTLYNLLIDFSYADGKVIVTSKENKKATTNGGEAVTLTGIESKSTNEASSWSVEASIPFTAINATTGTHFYLTYSSPKSYDASNKPVDNNALFYGKCVDGPEKNTEGKEIAKFPYALWDSANDVDVTFADIKLGTVKADEPKPDWTNICGEKIADPQYELAIDVKPATYKPGDTITVSVSVKNIKPEKGLALVKFLLYYDATKVEPVVKNDGKYNKNMNDFLKKAPVMDDWSDSVCKLDETAGFYDISFGSAASTKDAEYKKENFATSDGSIVIEVPFKVKASVSGTIAFQIPHGENGTKALTADKDLTRIYGNAGYALAKLSTVTPPTSSTSSNGGKPGTGDNGIYAIALIAMVALAGAATVAVKKRSR